MNIFQKLMMVAVLAIPAAYGNVIGVAFDLPSQTGNPGQTIRFFGVITNVDTTNGADTNPIFFNSDSFSFSLGDSDYTLTDDFQNTPFSLAPGETSGDIELFDITLTDPFGGNFGVATGIYGLVGGEGDASENLAQQNFSIDVKSADTSAGVTPEPTTWMLVAIGLGTIWRMGKRRPASR